MKKSTYVFISLLLAVKFWDLSFLAGFLKRDGIFILTILWCLLAYLIFYSKPKQPRLFSLKYNKYIIGIFLGVFISVFSAFYYWGQPLSVTILTQRFIYVFILLPSLLFVQPTPEDIIKSLKWISVFTILVWCLSIFAPQYILDNDEVVLDRVKNKSTSIGLYTTGIEFVLMYIYVLIQEFIKSFTFKKFSNALLLLLFFLLYQNRSYLIGILFIFLYSMLKFKSKYKLALLMFSSICLSIMIIYTIDIWNTFILDTQTQLSDMDYNRWKALFFYFNDYSPNWFCYIFGNGMPSATNSEFGSYMLQLWKKGIFASDLGMIGMWTDFGLLPVILIYSILISVILKSRFPLMLKFICFHILLVPTIFHFWGNPTVSMFCLIIYLYAYYNENKTKKCLQS
jgi:hypothetical protein